MKLQKNHVSQCLLVAAVAAFVVFTFSPAYAAPKTLHGLITFYGFPDNSPPGNGIAFPVIHDGAGGTGTFSNPITFATDQAEHRPGTRLYVPFLQKYFIMEDDCVECDNDWNNGHKRHVDLWTQSDADSDPQAVIDCEDTLTQDRGTYIVNPSRNMAVDTTPLFDNNNGCIQ
jgi:hypothetical protein